MATLKTAITAFYRAATQSSHPATPAAGYGIFYDKDKSPYFKNSDGDEISLVAAGKFVQVVNTQTGAVATTTTVIPLDDTIPQNTEGGEFMTLAITPASATNILYIDVVASLSPSTGADITMALFKNTDASAVAAFSSYMESPTGILHLQFSHKIVAGGTSAITFKVRAGMGSAGTLTFNGQGGARRLGGVMASSITITEVTP